MSKVWLIILSVCTIGYSLSQIEGAIAQVVPDNTLNTQVNQNGTTAEITGGETRGGNLFHSFDNFSVPTGNTADFLNSSDIGNIFSRVTGGNISNIDGLLRANDANLFLINPAGIMFGSEARLDLGGGSFYGTSADSVLFEEGEFSATDTDSAPLLTINAPIGLSFRDEPAAIVNNSTANEGRGLTVQPGSNLSLLGGEIRLNGGAITAPGGTINLSSLSSAGIINLDADNIIVADESNGGNITLTDTATLNVRGDDGGAIEINADNLTLTDASLFLAGIDSNSGSNGAQAGNIDVTVNNIIARDDSQIRNENFGTGNAGNINITTGNLEFTERSGFIASTFGQGNAGDVIINATGDVSFDLQFGGINTNVGLRRNDDVVANSFGDAGNIDISAANFSLTNGARLVNKTAGEGNAGNVNLDIAETVLIEGEGSITVVDEDSLFEQEFVFDSGILTQATQDGVGNSGDITINAQEFILDDSAIIAADSSTVGDAGNITINASESVFFGIETLVLTQIQRTAQGDGGDIEITTKNLNLVDSFILSDSAGEGDAGSIIINASESVLLQDSPEFFEGSLIISGVGILGDETEGNAGNIEINAESLTSEGSSFIVAQTNGIGEGGDIIIQTQSGVFLEDSSRILSQVQENAVGDGGEISITSPTISLNDVAAISTTTLAGGEGTAGNITLDTENLTLTDGAIIDALTENEFNGGDISISANNLNLLDGGKIVTATDSTGNAGNISLDVSDRLNISGSNPQFNEFLNQLREDEIVRGNPEPEIRSNADDRFRFATPSSILTVLGNTSGLFANTSENSTGNGGNVSIINPMEFNVSDSALISVGSEGIGSAGSLAIASDSLSLNDGTLFAATPSGVGGNITLSLAENLVLENQGLISSQATGNANGGNIDINSQFVIAFPNQNNDIIANAEQGIGGNINITTEAIFGLTTGNSVPANTANDIDASSQFGLDGEISINVTDVNPVQGTVELPQSVVEPTQTVAQACQTNQDTTAQNRFVIRGKGGVPPAPDSPLNSESIYLDTDSISANPLTLETSEGETVIPARGIRVNPDGTISLISDRTDNSGTRIPNPINCRV